VTPVYFENQKSSNYLEEFHTWFKKQEKHRTSWESSETMNVTVNDTHIYHWAVNGQKE
jgi:hypothetical protein